MPSPSLDQHLRFEERGRSARRDLSRPLRHAAASGTEGEWPLSDGPRKAQDLPKLVFDAAGNASLTIITDGLLTHVT
jgi:hypothetical protein